MVATPRVIPKSPRRHEWESGENVKRSFGWLRRRVFGIRAEEVLVAQRGFRVDDDKIRGHLEQIGGVFLHGYHAALEAAGAGQLAEALDQTEGKYRGFAFEGASMGLFLLDLFTPWKGDRLRRFLAGPAARHAYMVHVGAGWALAQLRCRVDRALAQFDPLLGWLAIDGLGFHQGYFRWPDTVIRQRVPSGLTGYARRAFDQGLGRSLWFVEGAEFHRIAETIRRFPEARHPDLWSGVGLACAYAGGVPERAIESLKASAGPHSSNLAQGAAFAAKARERAGNPAAHTELACQIICGMPAKPAASLTDRALEDLSPDGALPAYEVWRQRIRANWIEEVVTT
jgi:enediyne biosynthesis protein E3